MLDLSYLAGKDQPAPAPEAGLDEAYARYLADARAQNPGGVAMSAEDFERYSLGSGWLSGLKDVAKKVVQTCRLVIGIHDYEYYLDHMRSRHPEATPFTREEFYRYCLEARFPSAERAGTRCPC
ncbi:YbdD/YjiX family protein [Pseudothauera nasutitermitis]|uniref:YbdD/YjiX family protein n=1 Tax=Pseudothauera nasutitermitis TaxID=2565930 RepID=A0A4S4AWZ2_9RHOO|nr:YbdD/YjiX family protein [Pseudothauera nasutitermitis]THF63805.1 YbdD/YjiX family protein [Pseudothauera nasutitermitis]